MGNVVSVEGLRPCPRKVEAIVSMPIPEDKAALQRFLIQFVPNESSLTAPLRQLLKKDSVWSLGHEHTAAIEAIKQAIAQPTLLRFIDVSKPVLIQTDASRSGLGACLLQDGAPIAFASRSLTQAEENYVQIEKKLLAITLACAKFH